MGEYMRYKQVVVIGGRDASAEQIEIGYQIGSEIALRGFVTISGGKSGVMQAVSRGAADHGGIVIGILPGTEFDEANEYCSVVIPTGIGYARNLVNVLSGDLIISIGGATGTLSELAYAWQYRKKIVACSFTGGWSAKLAGSQIDDYRVDTIIDASSMEDVKKHLDMLLN
ncbi:MAG: TIGR00725 family protein [Candidatus Auribacterota bacterium]